MHINGSVQDAGTVVSHVRDHLSAFCLLAAGVTDEHHSNSL